jgi:hypothetical protein
VNWLFLLRGGLAAANPDPTVDPVVAARLAAERGQATRDEIRRVRLARIDRRRARIAARYASHVDGVIASIPARVEWAVIHDRMNWMGHIPIEHVFSWRRQSGNYEPCPGSYTEYLYNRLRAAGFLSRCRDANNFLTDMTYLWYTIVSIDKP